MKKIISVLLSALLTVAVLTSCAKQNSADIESIKESLVYSYDSAYSFDDATIRAYNDICGAVINGDEEVRINIGMLDDALQLFYTSFPLNDIVESIMPTQGAYKITYKYEDHANRVSEFLKKKYEIQTQCESENDTVFALNVYNYIASSIKLSDNSAISCYETVMSGEGTSFSYSNMFEYLLQQKGIKAYHVLCEDENGASEAISMAELDGELYYFDLIAEYTDNGGKLLKYFGMTSKDAENNGIKNMIYTNRQPSSEASDKRFAKLKKCISYEIKGDNLLVTVENGKIVQIAL